MFIFSHVKINETLFSQSFYHFAILLFPAIFFTYHFLCFYSARGKTLGMKFFNFHYVSLEKRLTQSNDLTIRQSLLLAILHLTSFYSCYLLQLIYFLAQKPPQLLAKHLAQCQLLSSAIPGENKNPLSPPSNDRHQHQDAA